ncbi:arylesterase [Erythrobacter sp. SDW2]|uniref:arylesterase n=1 Tax=Erythrobacter sp. SDW2 TaxID=2907154 RepID=UPI001F33E418|nr:arylesterase [Erythrobacter sp. SDW2]UIP07907.1 arylesterase [Erythrobacter sp. SDW2]
MAPLALMLVSCGSEAPEAAAPVATEAAAEAVGEVPVMGPERHILAFGDSLFAGYNVAKEDSYPAKLEAALRARGINARVTNAGVSGDTSAAGAQRFDFTLKSMERTPDLLILELGGNDLLRGLSTEQVKENLRDIITKAQREGIDVLLMGMQAPPNVGPRYAEEFKAAYADLAKQYGVDFIPFWVEAVADKPELIQSDRVHPTEKGIEVLVGDTVDEVIAALPKS